MSKSKKRKPVPAGAVPDAFSAKYAAIRPNGMQEMLELLAKRGNEVVPSLLSNPANDLSRLWWTHWLIMRMVVGDRIFTVEVVRRMVQACPAEKLAGVNIAWLVFDDQELLGKLRTLGNIWSGELARVLLAAMEMGHDLRRQWWARYGGEFPEDLRRAFEF